MKYNKSYLSKHISECVIHQKGANEGGTRYQHSHLALQPRCIKRQFVGQQYDGLCDGPEVAVYYLGGFF